MRERKRHKPHAGQLREQQELCGQSSSSILRKELCRRSSRIAGNIGALFTITIEQVRYLIFQDTVFGRNKAVISDGRVTISSFIFVIIIKNTFVSEHKFADEILAS